MGSSIDNNGNSQKNSLCIKVKQQMATNQNLSRAVPQPTPEHSLRRIDTQEGQTAQCYFNVFLGRKRKYFLIFLILVEKSQNFLHYDFKKTYKFIIHFSI